MEAIVFGLVAVALVLVIWVAGRMLKRGVIAFISALTGIDFANE